ncbi:hypothetical protein OPT61_g2643 [Boeremia exigua]|uniref:Uncharacterized protein n=1 Tax=Boeremia exigua TaxID=749465 RepID=A0ACC2IKT4_9PLEO|nr:hypothetical protein OPT61_g2643 [Boeremia exigua]
MADKDPFVRGLHSVDLWSLRTGEQVARAGKRLLALFTKHCCLVKRFIQMVRPARWGRLETSLAQSSVQRDHSVSCTLAAHSKEGVSRLIRERLDLNDPGRSSVATRFLIKPGARDWGQECCKFGSASHVRLPRRKQCTVLGLSRPAASGLTHDTKRVCEPALPAHAPPGHCNSRTAPPIKTGRYHVPKIDIPSNKFHRNSASVTMLTRRSRRLLPTLLLVALAGRAIAIPGDDGVIAEEKGKSRPEFAAALTGGEGCSSADIEDIRDGFVEMTRLFQAALPYDPNGQPAIELFGQPLRIANYSSMIENNLERAAQYANLKGNETVNPDVHVRCDDPAKICDAGNMREGDHVAYNFGNLPMINFCKDYFKMDALDDRVDKKASNQMEKERLHEYYNRATLWARMVMHISDVGVAVVEKAVPARGNSPSGREWETIITEGAMNTTVLAGVLNDRPNGNGPNDAQTLKYAYGVTRSKLLAVLSTQMPYDAANNAENYALYAQARYVLQKRGFYPNVPVMDFPNELSVLTNEQLQDGERCKYAYFDSSDVVARPPNMELKANPLPGAASKQQPALTMLVFLSDTTRAGCLALPKLHKTWRTPRGAVAFAVVKATNQTAKPNCSIAGEVEAATSLPNEPGSIQAVHMEMSGTEGSRGWVLAMRVALLISISSALLSIATAAVLPTVDHTDEIRYLGSRAKKPVKPSPPVVPPPPKPVAPIKPLPPVVKPQPPRTGNPNKPDPAPEKTPKTCKQIALLRAQEESDSDEQLSLSSRSLLAKRASHKGSRTKTPCNVDNFISGAYESFGVEKVQNPTAPVYGYKDTNSCINLLWHKGDTSAATKAIIKGYETEHVLEWQIIEEFLGTHLTKHFASTKFDSPDPIDITGSTRSKVNWCDAWKKAWEFKSTDTFALKPNGPQKTPFQWIADVYPSKEQWRNEFTLLQKSINSVKGRLFNDDRIFKDEDKKSKGKLSRGMISATAVEPKLAIARLRDVAGVRKYLGDAKVRTYMANVKIRLENRFDELEQALAKPENTRSIVPARGDKNGPRKIDVWKKQDLGKLWDVFMNNKWLDARDKQQKFMEKWILQIKNKYCTAAKIRALPRNPANDTPLQKETSFPTYGYPVWH